MMMGCVLPVADRDEYRSIINHIIRKEKDRENGNPIDE
ncbi:MAG: hypothetical protein ACI8RD_006656 [Bacillariaceae sp.]|jgi:hypothetical protein